MSRRRANVGSRLFRGRRLRAACPLAGAALLWALPGCGGNDLRPEKSRITVKGKEIRVEVARSPSRRERGLMYREEMPEDEGMLFVFGGSVRNPFWMRNTRIPLSIAFLARDGRVIEVREMSPGDETLHLPLSEYYYALEMNGGWFRRNGIGRGDVIGLGAAVGPDGAPTGSPPPAREATPLDL